MSNKTTFDQIYSQFLSSVPEADFGQLSDGEIKKELSNWLKMAVADFLFPYISTEYVEAPDIDYTGEGEFVAQLSQREINVLLAYMKVRYFDAQISNAKRYDKYYYDANMKASSDAPLLAQLNRAHEGAVRAAKEAEFNYSRRNAVGQPNVDSFKW